MATKNPSSSHNASSSPFLLRLGAYRPFLDRAIFGLAILGLLVAVHLTVQQSRGFEDGCFGFADTQASAFDCGAVTQSDASTLLGISNSIWGILFYASIALLTAAAAFIGTPGRTRFKWARATLIGIGFLYSMYLVYYQFFELSELCALCLVSAGIATLLAAAQAADVARPFPSTSTEDVGMTVKSKHELAYMGSVVALAVLLIGADVVYLGSGADPEPYMPTTETAARQASEPSGTAELNRSLPAECRYDADRGPVEDFESLVNFYDAAKGDPSASVTVIEYFDPNCPHCRTLHSVMEEVVQTHADQAHFVFKPFFLWEHSVAQSEALYAAAQEGKFFEMLEYQYAMQQPQTGLSANDLQSIAVEIGMDADELMQRLESGIYRSTLVEEKQEAVAIGVNSTPTVLINGRFVSIESRSAECMRKMIEQAARS